MQPSGGSGGAVLPFPARNADQVGFTREELTRILDLYGRMVAAGEWRDYAMDFTRDFASFAAFRRALMRSLAAVSGRKRRSPAMRSRSIM